MLHDPSGQITDAKGNPIVGAVVSLYQVPGAIPDADQQINDCRTIESRPGGVNGDWSSVPVAQRDAGFWVNPDLTAIQSTGSISPTVNPQVTGSDGRYAWDVTTGCWYVIVKADGYIDAISPLVGVPPEVTDLDIILRAEAEVYLPMVLR
jgi:hypothetical protein